MLSIMKLFVSLLISFVFFVYSVSPVLAKLSINEFSSSTGVDWVELYNDGPSEEPLSDYILRDDTSTNKLELQGILASKGFMVFEWGDRLNNPGDILRLLKKDNEVEEVDRVVYGNREGAVIGAPVDNQFAARQIDGNGTWALYASSSKGITNNNISPLPTATPLPTETPKPTPTPSKTPTPTKTPSNENVVLGVTTHVSNTPVRVSSKPTPTSDYHVPTAVLADKTKTAFTDKVQPQRKTEVKTKGIAAVNPAIVFMGVGTLFLLSCLGFGYYTYKKGML